MPLRHWLQLSLTRGLGPILTRRLIGLASSAEQACAAGATRLLVDNQTPEAVRRWGVRARAMRPGIEIEATGGITLENVRAYAEAGADFVSIGALTHSVWAADLAVEVQVVS